LLPRTEWQFIGLVWVDSAPAMPAFKCGTLSPFALTYLFYYTG
jgi:hypothetical protein